MPDIGEGVVEGEIVSWKVKVGDVVKLDQPIVEVMTDKATVELPSRARDGSRRSTTRMVEICPVGQGARRDRGGRTTAGAPAPAPVVSSGNGSGNAQARRAGDAAAASRPAAPATAAIQVST